MASESSIANIAMRLLGQPRVTSIDEGTDHAKVAEDLYESTKRACLETHNWTFAKSIKDLGPVVALESFERNGFAYAFQIPADCVFIRGFVHDDPQLAKSHSRVEDFVLCDVNPAYLIYTRDVAEGRFSGWFEKFVAGALAYEMTYALTGTESRRAGISDYLTTAERQAGIVDAQQDTSIRITADSLRRVR